jgi:hypothetical protein
VSIEPPALAQTAAKQLAQSDPGPSSSSKNHLGVTAGLELRKGELAALSSHLDRLFLSQSVEGYVQEQGALVTTVSGLFRYWIEEALVSPCVATPADCIHAYSRGEGRLGWS